MLTMWVTDYVANTAILVYKRANYLSYNITSNMASSVHNGIITAVVLVAQILSYAFDV